MVEFIYTNEEGAIKVSTFGKTIYLTPNKDQHPQKLLEGDYAWIPTYRASQQEVLQDVLKLAFVIADYEDCGPEDLIIRVFHNADMQTYGVLGFVKD
jgi:hypothetical protein